MLIEFMTSKFFFLATGLSGIIMLVLMTMYANRSIGVESFHDQVLSQILSDPQAAADYFGKRFIGFGIVIGCSILAGAAV